MKTKKIHIFSTLFDDKTTVCQSNVEDRSQIILFCFNYLNLTSLLERTEKEKTKTVLDTNNSIYKISAQLKKV